MLFLHTFSVGLVFRWSPLCLCFGNTEVLLASLSVLCVTPAVAEAGRSCDCAMKHQIQLCPWLSGVLALPGVDVKPSGAVSGQEGTCVSAAVGARAGV